MKSILEEFHSGKKRVNIGAISIKTAKMLNMDIEYKNIIMWKDRLSHIEKHKLEYISVNQYELHINMIPDIISEPDYIGKSKNGNGIEFIKKIDEISMVAVRVNNKNELFFRSLYPISKSKLANRIKSGRWMKYS
ncbi:MAG: PBECR2 nuclease fold domain-containing protein [Clostridia bacterium]|nr:PBECR2 nuclease fold domain-containing protein [Clostridia bacterium]